MVQSRRWFLAGLSAAGAAGLIGRSQSASSEPALETTSIRLSKIPGICIAPQYVAEELLRDEGFTDVRYVSLEAGTAVAEAMGRGELDISLNFAPPYLVAIDTGAPITIIAGVHIGCFELFARGDISSIVGLKGKSVGVQGLGSSPHLFLTSMAAHVGLDPLKDINWITTPSIKPMELFVQGKIDAFLGFPPEPQALRAGKIGRVVVSSAVDRPWSQYFCCMLAGHSEYVRKHPEATKRALRAILKATDLCVSAPTRAAQRIVDGGFSARYDYALQTLQEIPYGKWREYDPEDTMRFYSLLLHEAGTIKSAPNKIIAAGSDWRFWTEVKRELKA
jgi:NitT/TauT family transport system substrate-binding protein